MFEKLFSNSSGTNILLAKLSTRKAKPNGQFHLDKDISEFMKVIAVSDLPGTIKYIYSKRNKQIQYVIMLILYLFS